MERETSPVLGSILKYLAASSSVERIRKYMIVVLLQRTVSYHNLYASMKYNPYIMLCK